MRLWEMGGWGASQPSCIMSTGFLKAPVRWAMLWVVQEMRTYNYDQSTGDEGSATDALLMRLGIFSFILQGVSTCTPGNRKVIVVPRDGSLEVFILYLALIFIWVASFNEYRLWRNRAFGWRCDGLIGSCKTAKLVNIETHHCTGCLM